VGRAAGKKRSTDGPRARIPAVRPVGARDDHAAQCLRSEPGAANGSAVIICPGGGWRILAWEHEGTDLAQWLSARGYTAFVLKYRLLRTPSDPSSFAERAASIAKRVRDRILGGQASQALDQLVTDPVVLGAREGAAQDGRRALALVRERSAEWGLRPDRVGMVGFSAGAFLTADVALDPGGAPLAFAAPLYGGETAGHPIGPDAPPLFTAVAQDDELFAAACRRLHEAWSAAGRPAELHVFARGGHGFGLARQNLPVDHWVELLGAWLANLGLAR
jgi:acetyl esterase/lipase